MATFFVNRVKDELAEKPERKEELVGWYKDFRHKLTPNDQNDVGALLGLSDRAIRPLREVPFREMVPPGWFADVLSAVEQSESPSPFYFLASMCVMGNLLGRKVMIDRGTHRLGIEPSALLISPAGRGRRSTACDFIVYDIGVQAGSRVYADKFTYESFGDALREREGDERMLVYAGEMSTLLGKQSYGESIIPTLTDMITKTRPMHWGTVKRGYVTMENPCINVLFTSAPDWLVDNIPAVAFGGGLMSRLLVCVQEGPERIVTWGDKIPTSTMSGLVGQLRKISQRGGTFGRPEAAPFKWYDEWYHETQNRIERGDIPEERMLAYFSRKHDHLLRIAGLLTLAADEGLTFTINRMEQALKILDKLEEDIPKAYASMALQPIQASQHAVVRALQRNKGAMDHNKLHRAVYRHAPLSSHFREVMESLVEIGTVQKVKAFAGKGFSYLLMGDL